MGNAKDDMHMMLYTHKSFQNLAQKSTKAGLI